MVLVRLRPAFNLIAIAKGHRLTKAQAHRTCTMEPPAPPAPSGWRTRRYGDVDRLLLRGNPNTASRLAFFCAGYPDDHRAFLPLAKRLVDESGGDVMAGVACLPEYDYDGSIGGPRRGEGYPINEIVRRFGLGVAALCAESSSEARGEDTDLTLVLHDWAVPIGVMWANQELARGKNKAASASPPKRIMLFDVCPPLASPTAQRTRPARETLIHALYQGNFALSFALHHFVSPHIATLYLAVVWYVIFSSPILSRFLNPIGRVDIISGGGSAPSSSYADIPALIRRGAYLSYPYYYVWKAVLAGKAKQVFATYHLPLDLDKCPVLFLYGADKNTMYHYEDALDVLDKLDGCGQMGVAGAGHWLYRQQPDVCYGHVKEFIVGL